MATTKVTKSDSLMSIPALIFLIELEHFTLKKTVEFNDVSPLRESKRRSACTVVLSEESETL
ncbi:hypothetical protein J6590_006145 [Homalodisca vitripennis]|nr:hypothetical protein J6590_006145 [Homalodisca vitripennis]